MASCGDGPLVLLLHGFPEFWWTWRHQLVSLSTAGYWVVAADLRGYGGSDKPPRGYDLVTAAADAAGLIRALGEANAVVIGHDWGGLAAWTLAAYFPKAVRRLAVVSMAHPLQMRAALLSSPLRISRSVGLSPRRGYPLAFQLPLFPERQLVRDGAALVGSILSAWAAPGWPDPDTERVYRRAIRIPSVAHSALEYHRWFARSSLRTDGVRYARHMRSPIAGPDPAPARRAGPVRATADRAWRGPLRRRALPLEGHRGRRALPARGASRPLRRRTARLAGRPRAGQVSEPRGGASRDRDPACRPRNARPRDELGRPLARITASDVPRIPDDLTVTPARAVSLGGSLLAEGRPFHAHEVFEAAWKAAPEPERELWRGLAQIAVGLTHAPAAANAHGAVTLLRRGAARIRGYPALYGADPQFVAASADEIALRIARDGLPAVPPADLRLALSRSPG